MSRTVAKDLVSALALITFPLALLFPGSAAALLAGAVTLGAFGVLVKPARVIVLGFAFGFLAAALHLLLFV